MKILVTGAAGFIGSFTSRELISKGHEVFGIDNFDPFYSKRAKKFNLALCDFQAKNELRDFSRNEIETVYNKLKNFNKKNKRGQGSFEFIKADILDIKKLKQIFEDKKLNAIVHLAAMAGVPHSIKHAPKYSKVNINGTVNLLEQCHINDITNFVFASSSSVYGNCTQVPFKENMPVDRPISPYAATKRMNEIMNFTYNHLYKINICNLRFFTVYGPLQRPYGMAIQKFIKQTYRNEKMTVYGDGKMARDYTYIDDITEGILSALNNNEGFSIYNLGNEVTVDLLKLTNLIKKEMGKGSITHLEIPPTEVPITYADISKAKKNLGFQPKIKIEEGIKRQIEIFNLMPDWYKNL